MTKKIRSGRGKRALRLQGLRLLTLLCFFHFTGLNNGGTIGMAAGDLCAPAQLRMERVDFSVVILGRVGFVMNPRLWLDVLRSGSFETALVRSGAVVERLSQRAVENMILGSSLLHLWANNSIQKIKRVEAAAKDLRRDRTPPPSPERYSGRSMSVDDLISGLEYLKWIDPAGYVILEQAGFCGDLRKFLVGIWKAPPGGAGPERDVGTLSERWKRWLVESQIYMQSTHLRLLRLQRGGANSEEDLPAVLAATDSGKNHPAKRLGDFIFPGAECGKAGILIRITRQERNL